MLLVSAGQQLTLRSGGDTTLQGAVASGQRVTGDIGGQLRIDSLQDSSRYDSRQQNAGFSVAAGTGSASGSVSAGNTRIDSDYLNVAEQSGLKAGDGGFQLTVKGDTTLSGGVIASSDAAVQAGVNRLDTTATHLSDLHNQASYKASGYSVNVGVSSGKPSGSAGIGQDSGSAASDTRAGISGIAGNSSVSSGDAETGIANPFDAQRVAANVGAQVAISAEFGRQAPRAWADFAQAQYQAAQASGNAEEAAKWAEGGAYRVAGHSVLGGLSGGVAGAAGAASSASLMPRLGEQLDSSDLPAAVKQAIGMVASATLGAVSGGAAGAAMGLNVDVNNRQLHPDQVRLVQAQAKKLAGQQGLTAAEWEKRLLTQLAYQNSEMYVRYGNDPQAEAILTTLQNQSGVQMDYRATAAYRNDALNLQYLPQLTQAYQQLPPLNGSMSQVQFARYAGLLSGDFVRIPATEQREVVRQLQSEYQATLKQQLAQDQAGQSAGGQALQLAARLEVLNKLVATAEYAAVRSGAISESEASAMQRAMAAGMLVPSQGVNAKPQGVPPAKGQVVAPEGQKPIADKAEQSAPVMPAAEQIAGTKPASNTSGKVDKVEALFGQTFASIPLSHTAGRQDGDLGETLALQLLNEKTTLKFQPLQNANGHGCDGCAVAIHGDTITVVVMDAKSSQAGIGGAKNTAGDPEARLRGWLESASISGNEASPENRILADKIRAALLNEAKVKGITVKVGVPAPGTTGSATFKVEPWPK